MEVHVTVGDIVGETKGVNVGVTDIVGLAVGLCGVKTAEAVGVFVRVIVVSCVSAGVLGISIMGPVCSIFFGLHDCAQESINNAAISSLTRAVLRFILMYPGIFSVHHHRGLIPGTCCNTSRLPPCFAYNKNSCRVF